MSTGGRVMIEPPAEWFSNRIITGIQRLYTLGLPGSPAADVLDKTADTWVSALWPMKLWDEELDRPRLTRAFVSLTQLALRWPVPRELLNHMPDRKTVAALPPPDVRADPAKLAAARAVADHIASRFAGQILPRKPSR